MDANRIGRLWQLLSIAAALVWSGSAHAADPQAAAPQGGGPDLSAQLMTRVAHTDNLTLAPKTQSNQSESVAEVVAGINFDTVAPRLDAHVRSQVDGVFYDKERAANEVFNTLDASTQVALVLQRLFLDAFAIYDQTVVDAAGKGSFNKLALTGNRTDVGIFGLAPRVAINVGDNVSGEARYSDTRFDYADASLQDLRQQSAIFTLGNSKSRRGPSWSVNYDSEQYDYDLAGPIAFKTFDTQLGFWATETFRLFTTQGLESDYAAVEAYSVSPSAPRPGLDDHYWYVGFDWRPNASTSAVVSAGEHQFGRAYSLELTYRRDREGIIVSYAEQPTTFLRDQLNSAVRAGELSPVDTPDGPRGNPYYLQKRAGVVFVLDRRRSYAALRLYSEQRYDIQAAANNTQIKTEDYSAVELSLGWDITPLSFLRLSSQLANRKSTLNVVNDQISYTILTWGRQVGRQGELTASLSQERGVPYSGNTSENDYEEHQISVGISRRFGSASASAVPVRFNGFLNGPTARY
jgi:uncharacterized protein (PEP-CTERM system associated)